MRGGSATCPFCTDEVFVRSERAVRGVTGWERPRTQGGANQIMLRTPLDVWAHVDCVDMAKKGHVGQEKLL